MDTHLTASTHARWDIESRLHAVTEAEQRLWAKRVRHREKQRIRSEKIHRKFVALLARMNADAERDPTQQIDEMYRKYLRLPVREPARRPTLLNPRLAALDT